MTTNPKRPCPDCGEPMNSESDRCQPCYAASRREETLPLRGPLRQEFGCILSFEAADGERLSLHGCGPMAEMVSALCDVALMRDASFRVVAYSTPETIHTDIQGRRSSGNQHGSTQRQALPEQQILARARRPEMLHVRLMSQGRSTLEQRAEHRTKRRRA